MNLIPWRNKQKEVVSEEHDMLPALRGFRSEMDRLFDRFFQEPLAGLENVWPPMSAFGPTLDLTETDTEVIVKAEIPGVAPKDVDVTVSGNVLTIAGEKKESSERKGQAVFHTERRFGSFRRTVQLPSYVDAAKVSAEHADGVLTIRVAKSTAATPKRVEVKAI